MNTEPLKEPQETLCGGCQKTRRCRFDGIGWQCHECWTKDYGEPQALADWGDVAGEKKRLTDAIDRVLQSKEGQNTAQCWVGRVARIFIEADAIVALLAEDGLTATSSQVGMEIRERRGFPMGEFLRPPVEAREACQAWDALAQDAGWLE